MKARQFLYVIESEFGRVKVGVAANPEARMRSLQLLGGQTLRLMKAFGPYFQAVRLEHAAHRLLAESRLHGEWFCCSAGEAIGFIEDLLTDFIDEVPIATEVQPLFEEILGEIAFHDWARMPTATHEQEAKLSEFGWLRPSYLIGDIFDGAYAPIEELSVDQLSEIALDMNQKSHGYGLHAREMFRYIAIRLGVDPDIFGPAPAQPGLLS